MISKKQRKSSRFYNTVKRKHSLASIDSITTWKVRSDKMKRDRAETSRWNKTAPPDCIPSIHWKRETKTQTQSPMSFIPRSTRAIISLFKRKAA